MSKREIRTSIALDGEAKFRQALQDAGRQLRVLSSETKAATSAFGENQNSIEALTAKNSGLSKEIAQQKEIVEALARAVKDASEKYGDADKRTDNYRIKLNNATTALNKMEAELRKNSVALEEAKSDLNQASDASDAFGNSIEKSANKTQNASVDLENLGEFAKKTSIAMTTAMAAVGAALGKVLVEIIEIGDEYQKASNQIAAATGATGDELDALGDIAKNVYKNNFGDSLEDVADGLSVVKQTTGLVGAELQSATQSGFALRETFGFEMQESARTVNSLVKNFGLSAEDAYNIIAVGAQNGADKNGDLLDTLNEYSAQYSALGLSADQFITSLISGADMGVFSIDKVGDAVKEFNIRAKDGSTTTREAFDMLGMNADEMMGKFASGGETAQEAFFDVVDALDTMQNPMTKNAAAVNLFGTQFEDLEANVLPILASMEESGDTVYDALTQINTIKYNSLEGSLQRLKRTIQDTFSESAQQMSAGTSEILNGISDIVDGISGGERKIRAGANDISQAMNDMIPQIVRVLGSLSEALARVAPSIIGSLVEGITQVLPSLAATLMDALSTLAETLIGMMPELLTMWMDVATSLVQGLAETLPTLIPTLLESIFDAVIAFISNAPQLIDAGFALVKGLVQGIVLAIPKLIEGIGELFETLVTGSGVIEKAVEEQTKEIVDGANNIIEAAEESEKAFADTTGEILAQAKTAERLTSEIEELNKKEKLNNTEQRRMQSLVSQLNDIYPDLALEIDNATGKLITNTSEIYANIEAMKQSALAQAYLERSQELAGEMADAMIKIAEAEGDIAEAQAQRQAYQAQLNTLQQQYNDLLYSAVDSGNGYMTLLDGTTVSYDKYNQMLTDVNNNIISTNYNIQMQDETIDTLNGTIGELNATYAQQDEQMDIAMTKHDEMVAAIQTESNATTTANGEMAASAEERAAAEEEATARTKEALDERLGYTQNAFDEIKSTTKLTVDELTRNLSKNQETVETWATNLGKLASRGLDQGLLQALREAGPEAAGTVQNLVNASDEELAKLNDVFKNGADVAVESLQLELGTGMDIGSGIVDDLATGVEGNTGLQEAAADSVRETKVAMQDQVADSNFPSVGKSIISGISRGLAMAKPGLLSQAKSIAREISKTIKDALEIHSPSAVMKREVGMPLAEGIEVGFTTRIRDSIRRMQRALPTASDFNTSNQTTKTTNTVINIYPQQMTAAQMQYVIQLANRELGAFA